ncbi:hypothetical protein [Endozoicomonas atrinae]|uniref:hypothetical protein n=1 Tax=Endozoicomonas atrinae TaxID=1333660 RepID=UPI0008242B5E|nr:hypothetical protein [Endozoicomonas atrinae]
MSNLGGMPDKRSSFEYLASLYDTSHNTVCRAWLDIICPNDAQDIVSCTALQLTGLAWEIPVDGGDHRGIEWQEVREVKPGEFYWFNVDEGYVSVTEEQQRQYRYDHDWLKKVLQAGLSLDGEFISVVPEHLDYLGGLVSPLGTIQVFLARQYSSQSGSQAIAEGLKSWPGSANRAILTPGSIRRPLTLEGTTSISVCDLLSGDSGCYLDASKLQRHLALVFGTDTQELPVHLSDYGSNAVMHADERPAWHVTGEKRCHVLRLIYQAWADGNKGVSTSQLQAEGINFTHPQNCFNDDIWPNYINYEKKLWTLKAPPQSRRKTA